MERQKLVLNLLSIVSITHYNLLLHTCIKLYTNILSIKGKPRFIKKLQDTVVDEGATLHLTIEVDACPAPNVKWLRNGNDVSADARIKITRDSHRHESYNLTVDLVKYEDQGEYEVVVQNTYGTVSSKSSVTVQSKSQYIHSKEVLLFSYLYITYRIGYILFTISIFIEMCTLLPITCQLYIFCSSKKSSFYNVSNF